MIGTWYLGINLIVRLHLKIDGLHHSKKCSILLRFSNNFHKFLPKKTSASNFQSSPFKMENTIVYL